MSQLRGREKGLCSDMHLKLFFFLLRKKKKKYCCAYHTSDTCSQRPAAAGLAGSRPQLMMLFPLPFCLLLFDLCFCDCALDFKICIYLLLMCLTVPSQNRNLVSLPCS